MSNKTDRDIIAEAIESFVVEAANLRLIQGGKVDSPRTPQPSEPDEITKMLDGPVQHIKSSILKNSELEPHHITKALGHGESSVRLAVVHNLSLQPEHIHKALDDSDLSVRYHAIQHRNASPENISKALKDKDYGVRARAISHNNATSDHVTKALKDGSWRVRAAAIENPHATPDHITKALDDKHDRVREAAVEHPNAAASHIMKGISDPNFRVRKAARFRRTRRPSNKNTTDSRGIEEAVKSHLTEGSRRIKRVPKDSFKDWHEQDDDYLYHVTSTEHVSSIKKHGLHPGKSPTFTNYAGHSQGKVFLTDRRGVSYWKEKVRQHLFHNSDNPHDVAVIRVHKSRVKELKKDELGSSDSRTNSYYTEKPILPK